ncbi:hypothetical protein HDV05_005058 [Chytridiales sp. JEL 0842]|nr:hypothetical protein HDV05_005058 [Chytridiales sp. JEL 0842]
MKPPPFAKEYKRTQAISFFDSRHVDLLPNSQKMMLTFTNTFYTILGFHRLLMCCNAFAIPPHPEAANSASSQSSGTLQTTAFTSHESSDAHHCVTQEHYDNKLKEYFLMQHRANVTYALENNSTKLDRRMAFHFNGAEKTVDLWHCEREITWYMHYADRAPHEEYDHVGSYFQWAADMWRDSMNAHHGCGITFRRVMAPPAHVFLGVEIPKYHPNTIGAAVAKSFFPFEAKWQTKRTITVNYEKFMQRGVEGKRAVMLHEIGHMFGLRHEGQLSIIEQTAGAVGAIVGLEAWIWGPADSNTVMVAKNPPGRLTWNDAEKTSLMYRQVGRSRVCNDVKNKCVEFNFVHHDIDPVYGSWGPVQEIIHDELRVAAQPNMTTQTSLIPRTTATSTTPSVSQTILQPTTPAPSLRDNETAPPAQTTQLNHVADEIIDFEDFE